MRYLLLLAAFILFVPNLQAQTKSSGRRVEIDSATGQRHVYTDTVIETVEDITPRQNMLTINPLDIFLNYNLSYFRKLSNSIVVGLGAEVPTSLFTNNGVHGFGLNGEMRYHPGGKALRGFYFGPNIYFNHLIFDRPYYVSDPFYGDVAPINHSDVLAFGPLFGWQWFPSDEFEMGLSIKINYYDYLSPFGGSYDVSTAALNGKNGVMPSFRFDIGYAW